MFRICTVASLGLVGGLLAGCGGGAESAPFSLTSPSPSSAASDASSPPSTATRLDPAAVQGAWWSWAASAPSGRNPVEDETGEYCATGQSGEVWFLAGTFGGSATRRCTVPAGRAMVAPLFNLVGSGPDACADLSAATGQMTVDGVARPTLRWPATRITLSGVAGNPLTRREGTFKAYGCGLWAETGPLEPGRHKVTIRGSDGSGFRVAVDYDLEIRESETQSA